MLVIVKLMNIKKKKEEKIKKKGRRKKSVGKKKKVKWQKRKAALHGKTGRFEIVCENGKDLAYYFRRP